MKNIFVVNFGVIMKLQFIDLKTVFDKNFEMLKDLPLFTVDIDKDLMYESYLKSFPEGTNPIYKERTQHDCNCCKNYIRQMGNVVAIKDGKIVSLWDLDVGGAYQVVVDAMAALIKSKPIENVFLRPESSYGVNTVYQQLPDGSVKTWNHFFTKLPKQFVVAEKDIGTKLGDTKTTKELFERALKTLSNDAFDVILELIDQNSVYRLAEHKFAVSTFFELKKEYDKITDAVDKDVFMWTKLKTVPESVTRIRNTFVGTLLKDLSDNVDLEAAVGSFEFKAYGYKRPTALVTKKMIESAQAKIKELGYLTALERRYAFLHDISINNLLHANRNVKSILAGGDVFDDLANKISGKSKNLDKVESVSIEKFIADILPKAESIEVFFENRHTSNLVSLIAPVHTDAKNMFKWNNAFSWSYNGDNADSIKERVKKAGGSIEGDLCNRLAWDYSDDLDFHMIEPDGYEIYFGNRRTPSPSGGMLDLDANGADGIKTDPTENIYYHNKSKMKEGVYKLIVHNYSRRSQGKGFQVEIEFDGNIILISTDKILRTGEKIEVAQIKYSKKDGFSIVQSMPSSESVKVVWGLSTQQFHKCSAIMLSPNYWDYNAVGNKHYFFMLENCVNETSARGFYNEFLVEELDKERKVMEMVGAKMQTDESINQLSGVGFSSTQHNSVLCKVQGSFNRVIKVTF